MDFFFVFFKSYLFFVSKCFFCVPHVFLVPTKFRRGYYTPGTGAPGICELPYGAGYQPGSSGEQPEL